MSVMLNRWGLVSPLNMDIDYPLLAYEPPSGSTEGGEPYLVHQGIRYSIETLGMATVHHAGHNLAYAGGPRWRHSRVGRVLPQHAGRCRPRFRGRPR